MKRKIYLTKETMYQVFVRNHTKEGTFTALIPDLQRIKDLGISILYLTPIHPIGEVARKGDLGSPYAIKDYYQINSELGTLNDFKNFLEVAHSLGFKVIIDIVLHHTSPDAILYKEHPNFYFHKHGKPGNKVGEWSDIIDLDYKNHDLWEYMKDMLLYWVKVGIDGFRADVAPLIPLSFWQYVRAELDKVDANLIWLSESVEPSFLEFLHQNNHVGHADIEVYDAFDILYDYDVYPTLKAFLEGRVPLHDYLVKIKHQENEYPRGYLKIRTIENHDQVRISHLVKNDLVLKNITAWSFFARGVGYLYAGQEVKAKHQPSLFTKDTISLTMTDHSFYAFIKRLIKLKKALDINNGNWEILNNGENNLIVSRYSFRNERILGVFNLSGESKEVELPYQDGKYRDEISGKEVVIKNQKVLLEEPLILKTIL